MYVCQNCMHSSAIPNGVDNEMYVIPYRHHKNNALYIGSEGVKLIKLVGLFKD